MQFRLASIVLVLAAACGGKAKAPVTTPPPGDAAAGDQPTTATEPATAPTTPPAAVDPRFEAAMQAGLRFVAELGDKVAAAGTSCAAVAAAIEDTVARNRDTLAAISGFNVDPAMKARSDAWLEVHHGELAAAAAKLGPGVAPCTEDPAVQAAVQKLSM